MNRVLIYPGQVPLETDLLGTNKNVMLSIGKLLAAVLGTATLVNGLTCQPTAPASMQVEVLPGEIYSLANVDGTAYSSIALDTTHQIVKQGILLDKVTFNTPAPGTVGQSIVYLIQATFSETDGGSIVLPYYNASNPAAPYNGPANSGVAQNTSRNGVCTVAIKAGTAATTGTQVTPAADAGYTALWAVTVANGATTVTSPNIAAVGGAPFISERLGDKVSIATGDARWAALGSSSVYYGGTSAGAANVQTCTATSYTYAAGKVLSFIAGFTNTAATTMNVNSLGAKTVKLRTPAGLQDLNPGNIVAGAAYFVVYDGTYLQLLNESLASLRGVNGYCYNADGTMDQWGFSNASIAGNVVTFPVVFPIACDNITVSIANNSETRIYTTQATINATNFTFFAAGGTAQHYWRAKGRWI